MSNKLISCVISCYNEEKNIAILLDQIKSNNLEKNFEFIIVNNGSTDNSWQIICEKKNNFPEINDHFHLFSTHFPGKCFW